MFSVSNWGNQLSKLPYKEVFSFRGQRTRYACWLTKAPCNCIYEYGKTKDVPSDYPEWLSQVQNLVEQRLKLAPNTFNAANINMYKDDNDDCFWHQDNEKLFKASEFDKNAYIASVSLGATRAFGIRKPYDHTEPEVIDLHDGDIITMQGNFQSEFQHCIFKATAKPGASGSGTSASSSGEQASSGIRYNITFRTVLRHKAKCPCFSR